MHSNQNILSLFQVLYHESILQMLPLRIILRGNDTINYLFMIFYLKLGSKAFFGCNWMFFLLWFPHPLLSFYKVMNFQKNLNRNVAKIQRL